MSNGFYVVPKLVEDVSIKRSIGDPSDDAWDGSDLDATVISILKAVYDKAGKNGGIIAGFYSLTPDEGTTYFYPYPNTEETLPWRAHYGAGEYDTTDFGWTPPKSGHYKASFTGRIRASSSAYPALNLNYHVKDENNTNMGSIGCITVPSGASTSYCVHAEFFFHVTDPTKKAYFSAYNAGEYPTVSGHLIYVNDASLTYEYLDE